MGINCLQAFPEFFGQVVRENQTSLPQIQEFELF